MLRRGIIVGALALSACSGPPEDAAVTIAYVGTPEQLADAGVRLAHPAQQLRAATAEGLVALDANGEVVPGVAQSWIVTDDGLSYLFRLRETTWPDGAPVTAEHVRRHLLAMRRELAGTALGLDLGKIADVRVMTNRVVEIELNTPMAQFLRLLAQPELGLIRNGQGLGPLRRAGGGPGVVELVPVPPRERGLPQDEDWQEGARRLRVTALPAARAVQAFADGDVAAVLGGDLASLPLLDTGPLARRAVRAAGALGTFGLDVTRPTGFLQAPENREAVAMAIDRSDLLAPFNLPGWTPATRIVPPSLPGNPRQNAERWTALELPVRQAIARGRVRQWQDANGPLPPLKVALPPGLGSDLLFAQLAGDLAAAGIPVARAAGGEAADLTLRDRLARYGQARWFLNQFNCRIERRLCAPEADELVARSNATLDGRERAALLAQAEDILTNRNLHIPLGAPVRWSLVSDEDIGFSENPWAAHPLFPFSHPPT